MDIKLQEILNRVLAQPQPERTGETNQTTYDLRQYGITKRYFDCTFAEIEKRGIPKQVKSKYGDIKSYVNNLIDNVQKGVGLILKGPVGTMKTTLAIAILQEYIQQKHSGLFIPMVSMLDNIFTMKARSMEEWIRYEDRIRKTGLLVLDDLGAEYHQEWVLSKVDSIISDRYNEMKPIIITTNLSNAELKGKYAERIIDRLRSTSKVINFDGESLREAV